MKKSRSFVAIAAVAFSLGAVQGAVAQSVNGSIALDAEAQLSQEAATRENAHKQELIASILTLRENASGRRFSAALRYSLGEKLDRADVAALEAFANAGGLGNVNALVPNVLGASAADLVFTPVTPCRIVNTVAIATPLAANTSRSFYVNGNTAAVFEAQGGNPGGCGIPDAATAVAMNFIAVAPAAAGDFRAFPWAASPTAPLASVINFANLGSLNIANGVTQPVCDPAAGVCSQDLIVQADVAQSHLIIDVVGYYTAFKPALPTRVTGGGGAVAGSCGSSSSFTYTAPRAGKLLVTLDMTLQIDHVNGTASESGARIGTTATDCTSSGNGNIFVHLPPTAPTGSYYLSHAVAKIFDVTAGVNTFFANAFRNSGGLTIYSWAASETFTPN